MISRGPWPATCSMPRRRCSTSYVARTGASPETQPYRGQRLHLVTGAERFGAEDQLVRQELDQPEVIDERHHPADAATERASVPARALDEPGMAGRDEACAEHQHHEHQSSSNRRHHACLPPLSPPARVAPTTRRIISTRVTDRTAAGATFRHVPD